MFVLPLPWVIAEIVIFFSVVNFVGFFNTMLIYFVPCLLGILIVNTVGRMAMMSLQSTVSRGQLPANKLLHSGAVFIAGLCFLVPSAFTRVAGIFLILPGFRHLIVWRFKLYMAKKMASGSARVFNFGGGGPFGFGGFGNMGGMGGGPQSGGPGGFQYYEFRNDGTGFRNMNEDQEPQERELTDVEVLDVTPLEITHEQKKKDE